jgi:predicted ABC-type transport system involved in lysophospholipase L1 biosynthesis ATPase subunit
MENVALPLHLQGLPRKQIEKGAGELLALVQLGHRVDHLPEELSGGERQRVAIASDSDFLGQYHRNSYVILGLRYGF